jgi:hypothetical protein
MRLVIRTIVFIYKASVNMVSGNGKAKAKGKGTNMKCGIYS